MRNCGLLLWCRAVELTRFVLVCRKWGPCGNYTVRWFLRAVERLLRRCDFSAVYEFRSENGHSRLLEKAGWDRMESVDVIRERGRGNRKDADLIEFVVLSQDYIVIYGLFLAQLIQTIERETQLHYSLRQIALVTESAKLFDCVGRMCRSVRAPSRSTWKHENASRWAVNESLRTWINDRCP